MRKIFLVLLGCLLMTMNIASAEMLRVYDDDVQTLVKSMTNAIYNEDFQKERPLLLTNAVKLENLDLPEIGSTAWGCQFGLKTSNAPEGEVIFFVDGEEKVSALKIVAYSEASIENTIVLLFVTLQSLGMRQADAEFLMNNLKNDELLASSIVWSNEKKRCFVLMAGGRAKSADGLQFMLVASDKKD